MQISLVSWNVNGIRAVSAKDEFKEWFAQDKYDVISMQETKASVNQIPEHIASKDGYSSYFASSVVKKGYSGTAVYSKIQPLNVEIELPDPAYQGEGRIVHLILSSFISSTAIFQTAVPRLRMKTARVQVSSNVYLTRWAFLTPFSIMFRSCARASL